MSVKTVNIDPVLGGRLPLDETTRSCAAAVTDYGGERFVSAVQRGRQCAVQFHPEKSGEAGLRLLARFIAGVSPRQSRLSNLSSRLCECPRA